VLPESQKVGDEEHWVEVTYDLGEQVILAGGVRQERGRRMQPIPWLWRVHPPL
jgi:hypothetical protein